MLSSHQKRQILGRANEAAAPQGLLAGLRRAALLAACLTSLATLAACGQKGPLYLPGNPALPGSTATPTANPYNDNSNPNNELDNNPAVTR